MAAEVGGELDRLVKASSRQADDAWCSPTRSPGEQLSKAANNRRFRKALRVAPLEATHRIHDLRHTFGTRCAAAGVSMRTLQEWMGHRDIAPSSSTPTTRPRRVRRS